ncbi:MAG: Do family serine endopeptidase [Pirellulaceae bacterium]
MATPFVLSVAALAVAINPSWSRRSTADDHQPPILSPETMSVANAMSEAFRTVAKHSLPSVVAIETRADNSTASATVPMQRFDSFPGGNPFRGTPFEDMFRDAQPMLPRQPQQPREQRVGLGSGVIIDSSGIVLTNNHVVAGGGTVVVKTQDGREFIATEVLTDPSSDIAVVKFEGANDLVAAPLGDSDDVEVGDWVIALGQPFGLESTVTAGIVSAKNRGIGINDRESYIQTDAAINPGNSGGPLVNLRGEVVGINTAISSRSGGNEGIGFAVPANQVRWVSDQLLAHGKVNRSYLGVTIQPVDYELSTQLGVAPHHGVVVTNVFAGTPADAAGLQAGDVILAFGETGVHSPQELQLAVEQAQLGKTQAVRVMRDGREITLNYEPAAAPEEFGLAASSSRSTPPARTGALGLEVRELTPEVASEMGMEGETGLIVSSVRPDSSAAKAGIDVGMIIVQVNRQEVTTAADFDRLVREDKDGSILLLVRSEQGSRFVVVSR